MAHTARYGILLHYAFISTAQHLLHRCARIPVALLVRVPHECLGEERGVDAFACPSSDTVRKAENCFLDGNVSFDSLFSRGASLRNRPVNDEKIGISTTVKDYSRRISCLPLVE